MINHFFNFFFHLYIFGSFATRPDSDKTNGLIKNPNTLCSKCASTTGLKTLFCPDGTYVYGFQVLYSTGYGIISLVFECRKPIYDIYTSKWTTTDSQIIKFPDLGPYSVDLSLIESQMTYCNHGNDFIRRCDLRMWCPDTGVDAQGIVEIRMYCSYNDGVQPPSPITDKLADWSGSTYCTAGFVSCGYTLLKNNHMYSNYKYGNIDLEFECCRICDTSEGFFFDSSLKSCEHCDILCKECSGSATNCTQCYNGYSLNDTKFCVPITTTIVLSKEFFNTPYTFSTWSINSGTIQQSSCSNEDLIGGSNVFDKTKYIEKNFSSIPAHFRLIISVHIFKINDWVSGGLQIVVDETVQATLSFTDIQNPLYYDSCFKSSKKIFLIISRKASSLKIRFLPTFTGSGYWGINRFQVFYIPCDGTCLTCSGANANQCTSCASGKFLTAGSMCVSKCSTPYYGDTTTNRCLSICPNNYYMNEDDRLCYNKCPVGKYGNPLTGYCVATCPNEMYGEASINLCKYCDFNCLTCNISAINCIECAFIWLGAAPSCPGPSCI